MTLAIVEIYFLGDYGALFKYLQHSIDLELLEEIRGCISKCMQILGSVSHHCLHLPISRESSEKIGAQNASLFCSDFGFDPLGFGEVPENLARFQEAELIHCRWAMLGVVSKPAARLLLPISIIASFLKRRIVC